MAVRLETEGPERIVLSVAHSENVSRPANELLPAAGDDILRIFDLLDLLLGILEVSNRHGQCAV